MKMQPPVTRLFLDPPPVSDFLVELHVKTVKYFKSIERVQDEVEEAQERLKKLNGVVGLQVGSME